MLISSGAPHNLWGGATLTVNYVLNKVPHNKLEKTPYELWKGRKSSYKYLKVWVCLTKLTILNLKLVKIGPKTVDCVFIGYTYNSSAYRFLVYKSNIKNIHPNIIMESRNATFFKDVFTLKEAQKNHPFKRMIVVGPNSYHQSENDVIIRQVIISL